MKATWKIVDTVHGSEGPHFASLARAEAELERRRQHFAAQAGTHHAQFCQTIVPAEWTWGFHPHRNRFCWVRPTTLHYDVCPRLPGCD